MLNTIDETFFCCLCWNSTEDVYPSMTKNKLFCKDHLCSGETKKQNFRDKRLIIRSLANKNHFLPDGIHGAELYRHLSRNLTKLSIDPSILIKNDAFKEQDSLLSTEFRNLISRYYPISFKCIKACFNLQNVDELVRSIVSEVSKPSNSNSLNKKGIEQSPKALRQLSSPALLIHMLARHEAFQLIHETPVKRGPKKKFHRDETLRAKISQLYRGFIETGNYRCQSRIAEQLGISTARVSILMKELIREKKLTRNMTQNKN